MFSIFIWCHQTEVFFFRERLNLAAVKLQFNRFMWVSHVHISKTSHCFCIGQKLAGFFKLQINLCFFKLDLVYLWLHSAFLMEFLKHKVSEPMRVKEQSHLPSVLQTRWKQSSSYHDKFDLICLVHHHSDSLASSSSLVCADWCTMGRCGHEKRMKRDCF